MACLRERRSEYRNVMLNELDKELERRGHRFVRYADDCMIFCKSKKSAERTLQNIIPCIEDNLFLKVNREKTCVAHISEVKYLGYTFYGHKGLRFRVRPKSVEKMRRNNTKMQIFIFNEMWYSIPMLIEVTKLNDDKVVINSDLIEIIETTPDTVITLNTGRKLIVKESRQEIRNLVNLKG